MQSNNYRSVRFIIFFIACVFFCQTLVANPFIGPGTGSDGKELPQVSPVRTSATDSNLVSQQADLRVLLGEYFYSWKKNGSASVFWGIITAAFLYGILHALGPGHRKTVIFSLYLARNAPFWEPAGTGFLLALLHAGAAVFLLFILQGVSGSISGMADNISVYMEGFAYILLIVLALYLITKAIWDLVRGNNNQKSDSKSLGTILITGIYPCPGAILVLVLSLTLDITVIGILAVFAMSVGMSIPIIASGYLAWFGRTGIFLALKNNEAKLSRISAVFELLAYSFLLFFAFYMAEPFIRSVLRMAFK